MEAAPELCTECPNTKLITVEWLPGSDHTHSGFGPRQVCVPVPLPLPLAIPFHNRVYVCFQRHSAKAESKAETEATEAKQAEEEQTACVRVAAVHPGCSNAKFVCLCFQGHAQEGEAEATEAKQAEEEQPVCVRVAAVRPGCSDTKFCVFVFPGPRPRRRSHNS